MMLGRQRCATLALASLLLCLPSVQCFFGLGLKAAIPQTAPVGLDTPFLILPGFGNDQVDYIDPLAMGFEKGLQYCLQQKGLQVCIGVYSSGVYSGVFWCILVYSGVYSSPSTTVC
jgi:hypothetical protein